MGDGFASLRLASGPLVSTRTTCNAEQNSRTGSLSERRFLAFFSKCAPACSVFSLQRLRSGLYAMNLFPHRLLSWAVALAATSVLVFAAGCDSDDSGSENTAPTARFSVSDAEDSDPLTFAFDASQSEDEEGSIASYEWNFGDGNTDTGPTVTHRFSSGGQYGVTLEVTDDEGLSATSDPRTVTPMRPDPVQSVNYDTTQAGGNTFVTITETDAQEGIVPIDSDGNEINTGGDDPDGAVTWTSDYIYVLDGRTFVNEGQTLNIEPGTVIQGTAEGIDPQGTGTLIVARGATLDAAGTADAPIIFTAEGDDDPSSLTSSNFEDRGNWGGVILLGHAPNNIGTGGEAGVNNIEGLEDLERTEYGCNDDEFDCDAGDSSGTLRYVSVRFGGFEIDDGDEVNGVTLGSVGAGTTLEYVEAASNSDDGFEWFGGTVSGNHLVSSFVGDDAFDIDQGFGGDFDGTRGSLQYLLAVQGFDGGNRAGEHDSGDSSFGGEDSEPVGRPRICNATYIGAPAGDVALKLRDNFGGSYYNSLFTDFPNGLVEIEDVDGDGDSFNEFQEGNLRIENNLAFGFGDVDGDGDTDFEDLVENGGDTGSTIADYLADENARQASLDGFGLATNDMGTLTDVDPFPAPGSAAYGSDIAGGSSCAEDTDYLGAFADGENWIEGWTALSQSGVLGDN